MSANEYYEQKAFFLEQSLNSFHRLASRFEVIILEGAGSTMEVNLSDRDIVNLPFAQAVGAPAVLVADIDRGVFASIVGTLDLMHPSERSLIKSFIINRFRGEAALFESGRVFLKQRTGIPCFGILPRIESLRVDDEDSVSLEARIRQTGEFRIGVIKLAHVSNHTDFDRLDTIPGVSVEYIDQPKPHFDLVIIPGTKNTISDLNWLTVRGFRALIADVLEEHGWVLGICGGYQMLGESVSDPFAVEMGGTKGLGLLPTQTEMAREKITVQSSGRSFLGVTVKGYEIHMGRAAHTRAVEPFITRPDGTADGAVAGRVAGTYFHGLFENPEYTRRFLSIIARDRKLLWQPEFRDFDKDYEYDRLAAAASEHLDISRIYEMLA
jgi:adenosylcobyric acid synthase